MELLTEEIKAEIQRHAIECYDDNQSECCGFVTKDGVLRAINEADDPTRAFLTDENTSQQAEKIGILAIYHSHIRGEGFSYADAVSCRKMGVPFFLFDVVNGCFKVLDPTGNSPYIGREFAWIIHDCYSLVRDFYRREMKIELKDYDRSVDLNTNRSIDSFNDIVDKFNDAGFYRLSADEEPTIGDVLCFSIGGGNPRHLGVFYNEERNTFIHQLIGQRSKEEVWGNSWKDCCVMILRHKKNDCG